jgi:tryptophan synthase alpha chain
MSAQEGYFKKLQSMQLQNPVLIGFGIKDKATFETASSYANGAIIGTAYIKALEQGGNVEQATKSFLETVLN